MSVFEFTDYKAFLRAQIEAHSETRGYQTKLAEAAGCQRAFVSQVLHGEAQLTFDHAAGLCDFWKFRETESDYFIELLQLARAGTPALRSLVQRRLEAIQIQHSELSTKFKSTGKLSEAEQSVYYSNWIYSAIHVLTSIGSFQTETALADRLGVDIAIVRAALNELEGLRLIEKKSGKWKPSERNLFLPRQSHMTYMHHANWRMQALEDVQSNNSSSVHYSSLHAASAKDLERLREMILDFLKEAKTLIEPSPEEDMICLNIDYFKV